MDTIPDDVWISVFLKAGGFDDDPFFRGDVADCIQTYRKSVKASSISKSTRDKIQQTIDAGSKLKRLMKLLSENEEYLFAGLDGEEVSKTTSNIFAEVTIALNKLESQMKLDQVRFAEAAAKSREKRLFAMENLIINMLMLQSHFSGKPLPTSSRETTTSIRFRKFLKMCLDFASENRCTDEQVEYAIERLTESYSRVRHVNPRAWAAMNDRADEPDE